MNLAMPHHAQAMLKGPQSPSRGPVLASATWDVQRSLRQSWAGVGYKWLLAVHPSSSLFSSNLHT